MNNYRIPLQIIATLLVVTVSFIAGMWCMGARTDNQLDTHNLLAKRIFLSKPSDTLLNFEPLRAQLREELAYYEGDVSLYFEYLPTGTSIRIGDTQHMVAASLLKVPVIMELHKLAETGHVNLDTQVALRSEWLDPGYGDLYKKGAGYKLTLDELSKLVLEQSDNTALNAVQSVTAKYADRLDSSAYDALDVDFVDTEEANLSMSARAYASFMKCLYFSCYLSADASQDIMAHLARSTYGGEGRLGKYIPSDVPIAHKIGVAGNQVQSDCGIVYVPNRNYLLCVMLGEDKDRGSEVIAQVSKVAYDYVVKAR